jgi:predicted dehydrogenase
VLRIVTPNHVHHAAACVFLDAGIAVICDKPLDDDLATRRTCRPRVKRSGVVFAVTYNYTGYPMVRQAREMIASGALGALRKIQVVEYVQDWLSTPLEATGQKQAAWRYRIRRAGSGRLASATSARTPFSSPSSSAARTARMSRPMLSSLRARPPGSTDDVQTLLTFRRRGAAAAAVVVARCRPATRTACAFGSTARRAGWSGSRSIPTS